ncbi:hypothetical protein B0T19DRAFT_154280 [Cercophora scortea]|uniref:Uncharacterized protein n=1 Tax=Cercophora scortea TaxID=314031 RepID=A0AAE0MDK2_9PEZI|nr:hypothetical protein B0T19DRAFT_154280 [Cercophora scortea]
MEARSKGLHLCRDCPCQAHGEAARGQRRQWAGLAIEGPEATLSAHGTSGEAGYIDRRWALDLPPSPVSRLFPSSQEVPKHHPPQAAIVWLPLLGRISVALSRAQLPIVRAYQLTGQGNRIIVEATAPQSVNPQIPRPGVAGPVQARDRHPRPWLTTLCNRRCLYPYLALPSLPQGTSLLPTALHCLGPPLFNDGKTTQTSVEYFGMSWHCNDSQYYPHYLPNLLLPTTDTRPCLSQRFLYARVDAMMRPFHQAVLCPYT